MDYDPHSPMNSSGEIPKEYGGRKEVGDVDEEAGLVLAARRGDRSALDELLRKHGPAIEATLKRLLRDSHLADDVAQEAYLRALHAIRRMRPDVPFRAWLIAIARNIAIDGMRRGSRGKEVEIQDPDALPAAVVSEPTRLYDNGPQVWNAVRKLSDRDRRLVVLRYGRGLTNTQVALECGMTEDTVKVSLYRSRRRLRTWVEEAGAE